MLSHRPQEWVPLWSFNKCCQVLFNINPVNWKGLGAALCSFQLCFISPAYMVLFKQLFPWVKYPSKQAHSGWFYNTCAQGKGRELKWKSCWWRKSNIERRGARHFSLRSRLTWGTNLRWELRWRERWFLWYTVFWHGLTKLSCTCVCVGSSGFIVVRNHFSRDTSVCRGTNLP